MKMKITKRSRGVAGPRPRGRPTTRRLPCRHRPHHIHIIITLGVLHFIRASMSRHCSTSTHTCTQALDSVNHHSIQIPERAGHTAALPWPRHTYAGSCGCWRRLVSSATVQMRTAPSAASSAAAWDGTARQPTQQKFTVQGVTNVEDSFDQCKFLKKGYSLLVGC